MAKAGGEATTWIRYSEAKALVGEYLGDVTDAERAYPQRAGGRTDTVAVRTL